MVIRIIVIKKQANALIAEIIRMVKIVNFAKKAIIVLNTQMVKANVECVRVRVRMKQTFLPIVVCTMTIRIKSTIVNVTKAILANIVKDVHQVSMEIRQYLAASVYHVNAITT